MKILPTIICTAILILCFAAPGAAQVHAGKVDTDGILSPGEIPNPRINYGRAQYDRRYVYENDRHGWHDRDRYDHDRYDHDRHDHRWDHDRNDNRHSWHDNAYRGGDPYFSQAFYGGIKTGRISRREEEDLRREEAELRRRESEYQRFGISRSEREDLEDRASDLRKKLEHELNDGEKRW